MNPNKMFSTVRLAILSLMFIAVVPAVGLSATFTVNSTADVAGLAGNCVSGVGQCTLRSAVQAANATLGVADTIILPAGTYTLTIPGINENAAATGDLDITGLGGPLTISGAGAATTIIDGGALDGVFETIFAGGVGANATISGVTIRNGNGDPNLGHGGGIHVGNGTTVTLNNVIVTACKALGAKPGAGGVDNSGTLHMNTVAVTNNDSAAGAVNNGAAGVLDWTIGELSGNITGGGIQNNGTITLLENITISGNKSAGQGAGIDSRGTVNLRNVTVSGNTSAIALGIGGVRNNVGISITARNTIISGNLPANCGGTITSQGNNIDNGNTCAFAGPGDLPNTDPLLGALALNGGVLQTIALPAGSPAIDKGAGTTPATGCPATDARGIARPVDGNIPLDGIANCDIGAFEFRPQKLTVTLPPPFDFGTVTSATTSEHTVTLANAGDGPLIIGTIAAADPLAAPFSIPANTCSGQTLLRAGSCIFTTSFAPFAAVLSSDTFDIPSNDPAAATVTFALAGTGTAVPVPIIVVTDSVAPPNDLSVPFGSIQVGATKDETITITNSGTADLGIGTIASVNPLAAPFSISVDACSGKTIAPAATCTLTVHFAPTDNSALTDSFDIPTTEVDRPTVTVSLSGSGIAVSSTGTPVPGSTITVPGNNPPVIPILVTPANGQTGLPTTVLLSWNRSSDPDGDALTYQVINCVNQDFSGCTAVDVPVTTAKARKTGLGGLGTGMILIGVVAGGCSKRSRKALLVVVAMILSGTLIVACGGGGGGGSAPASSIGQMKFTVTGLNANTTYFWKVIVNDGKGGQATSETRNYKTQ